MTKPRDLATLGGGFTQSGTGATQRTVENKLKDTVSVKDFGAVGDGVANDTTAFQNAITYGCANTATIYIPGGTYRLTSTLLINTGMETGCSLVGMGGAKEPVLQFIGVNLGLLIEGSKSTLLKDIAVDMSQCTGSMVGIYVNAMWVSTFENVKVSGPDGASAPGGTSTYGILLRPQVSSLDTPMSILAAATAINSPVGINFGVYWNTFNKLDVGGFNYGIVLAGGEGGSNPRTNQNQFNQCRFNTNYNGIWFQGAGAGNVFISTTAEGNTGDSVRVESVSSGTGPTWIGGEMSGGREWVGPGLLLNPAAGTDIVNANTSGDTATHWRFTDQGAQAYGTKFTGGVFLSDWGSKADAAPTGTTATVGKTATVASVAILSATPISFLITVHYTDTPSPQGGAVLKYRFSGFDPNGAPTTQVSFVSEFVHSSWSNLGGGTVTPTLTGVLSGTTYTISANLGWNSVGNDPGEVSLNCTITELFTPGGSTVTLL